jgi:hypothetical protein
MHMLASALLTMSCSAELLPCPAPRRQANPYLAAGRFTVPLLLLDTLACQSFFNEVGAAAFLLMHMLLLFWCTKLSADVFLAVMGLPPTLLAHRR